MCEGGGEDGKEEEEADTELKTKTPHVNVGKYFSEGLKPPTRNEFDIVSQFLTYTCRCRCTVY